MSERPGESVVDRLVDAAPYGVGAYLIGLGVTFLIVHLADDFPSTLGTAGVVHGVSHVVVAADDATGETMLSQGEAIAFLFVAIPALPIVVLAYLYAASAEETVGGNGTASGDGLRRGVLLAGGYTAAMLAGALFFEMPALTGGAFGLRAAVGLDVPTAVVGAVVLSVGFGALGGLLADRDARWPFYVVVALLALPSLLLLFGASVA